MTTAMGVTVADIRIGSNPPFWWLPYCSSAVGTVCTEYTSAGCTNGILAPKTLFSLSQCYTPLGQKYDLIDHCITDLSSEVACVM